MSVYRTIGPLVIGVRMKAFTMQSNNKIGAWAHMRPPLCNFCRFIEDIEILFLHKCLLSSPPRFRQLLSKLLYSFGCYSNVKGKFSKKY